MKWSDVIELVKSARYVSTNFTTDCNELHFSVVTHNGDIVEFDFIITGENYGIENCNLT